MPTLTLSQKNAIKKSNKPAKELSVKYSVHLSTIYKVKKDDDVSVKITTKSGGYSMTPSNVVTKKPVAKKSTRVNA